MSRHLLIISLLILPILLYGIYFTINKYVIGQSLEGVHAMANGVVMNKKGEVIADAKIMPDGSIVSSKGKVIGSMYLGTRFDTSLINLPHAKKQPEMVQLHDGDTFELTAGYVQKEVGNRSLRMLAYNGSVPGPILKVEQGAEITINFNNNTDIEQTIHSHGIRIDNAYDGTPNVTQDVVAPGQSFTYKIHFPDAGVYWYHPHTREDYAQELGLYGNYLVEPKDSTYWSKVNREVPLVVDDILIDSKGTIGSFYKELTNFALLGRYGNTHLVNGEENYNLPVKAGEVIRFYVTNVANARTYNLSIPDAKLKLVGADVGKYEKETFVDSVLISPAERVVFDVYFPTARTYKLTHTTPQGTTEIASFTATESKVISYLDAFNTLRTNTDVITEFDPLRKYKYAAPDKKLLLTVALSGPKIDHSKHVHIATSSITGNVAAQKFPNIQWDDVGQSDMTNTTHTVSWVLRDKETKKENMDITDWNFKKGDLVKIQIENDSKAAHTMQHPIHFHGQRFIILDRNGIPNTNFVWKDTTLIEPGEVIDILVEMSNPGAWMAHCHIAEHLQAGMMLNFSIADKNGNIPGEEYRKTVKKIEMKH